jgi:hypothetical protein
VADLASSPTLWLVVLAGFAFVELLITGLLVRLCSRPPGGSSGGA